MSTTVPARTTRSPTRGRNPLFSALVGLAAVAILLQGVWAGLFLGASEDSGRWVEVHARGAEAAVLLSLAATVVGFFTLRARRDLWIGAAVLTVLLVVESHLGGLVGDGQRDLTVVHVPLALALMGLVVWLPLRARGRA